MSIKGEQRIVKPTVCRGQDGIGRHHREMRYAIEFLRVSETVTLHITKKPPQNFKYQPQRIRLQPFNMGGDK
jgi:hypothetical protein